MSETVVWLTTAGEYGPLAQPRKCVVLGEIKSSADGGTVVALAIDPPFSDPNLSPPCVNEAIVMVAGVWGRSYSLTAKRVLAIGNFDSPLLVSVCRPLEATVLAEGIFTRQNIQVLPRGALFRSEEGAARLLNTITEANVRWSHSQGTSK
jgi:hypothetical protein